MEEIDKVTLESLNKDYIESIIKENYEKNIKERKKILEKMKKDSINLKGDEFLGNKFKILNIGKNKENDVIYENKAKPKKKAFDYLDIKKCEGCSINATKKEKKKLIKINNDELEIKNEEIIKKENETQYDIKLTNDNLELKSDIKYKINNLYEIINIINK